MQAARGAWVAARVPYQQTEVFRFGNPIVDDWEGKVNAWPLDEGLIDYVDDGAYGTESDSNPLYAADIVAKRSVRLGATTIDRSEEHTSELQSLMRISYAVFCLKKNNKNINNKT